MKLTKDDKERILHGLAICFDYEYDSYLNWNDFALLTDREEEQKKEERTSLNNFVKSCKKLASGWGYDFLKEAIR